MRKKQGVELVLKPINMHGGGYSNFLRQIKKEAQTNYLAKFIIVDADRIVSVPGEKEKFLELLECCRIRNDKGNIPLAMFRASEKTRKDLRCTFVTVYGVKQNPNSDIVVDQVILDDLFT